MTLTILDDGRTMSLAEDEANSPASGRIRLSPAALLEHLGWELKPEGLCRSDDQGDVCVPVPDRDDLVDAEGIDLGRFAEVLGRPVVIDAEERVAALGTAATSQAARMASLKAPDFELPDLAGRTHTLAEHRGKKVLLIAYASW